MDPLVWEKRQEELKQLKKEERKAADSKARKAARAILIEAKKKGILVADSKAKKVARDILPEEKKKEILEIKKLNYEEKTFLKRKYIDNWSFVDSDSESDSDSNSRRSTDVNKILKEIFRRPPDYVMSTKFSPILIFGKEEAVISFQHPVDSAIVILSTPGYEINAEVRSGVTKRVYGSGITTEPFTYKNFNGTEWVQYHGRKIVEPQPPPPLISSFDNTKEDSINIKNGKKTPYRAVHTTKHTELLRDSWANQGEKIRILNRSKDLTLTAFVVPYEIQKTTTKLSDNPFSPIYFDDCQTTRVTDEIDISVTVIKTNSNGIEKCRREKVYATGKKQEIEKCPREIVYVTWKNKEKDDLDLQYYSHLKQPKKYLTKSTVYKTPFCGKQKKGGKKKNVKFLLDQFSNSHEKIIAV